MVTLLYLQACDASGYTSASFTNISNLQPSGSVASNHVIDNHGCTSKSTNVIGNTHELADSKTTLKNEGHSQPSGKHRINGIKCGTITSSHVS